MIDKIGDAARDSGRNRRRTSLRTLRKRIEKFGHAFYLLSSEGTQQYHRNTGTCLGCGNLHTVTGDILYRGKKENPFFICKEKCAKIWNAEQLQEEIDQDGKLVDIVSTKFEGRGKKHSNPVQCRVCDESYEVNGRALGRKIAGGGSKTPGCKNCRQARQRKHAAEFLLPTIFGPKYDIKEANRKQSEMGKNGKILEWNGVTKGGRGNVRPATAVYECGICQLTFPTFGTTIMNPACTTNNCPNCRKEKMRESAYKMHKILGYSEYNLETVKETIRNMQKRRNALNLDSITSFTTVFDIVDVSCIIHNKTMKDVCLWNLIQGNTPCEMCRAELIGEAQYSPWEETVKEMRKVEGDNISYYPLPSDQHAGYRGRGNGLLKHCSKDGHNKKDNGFFVQPPKLTIRQHSSCPDCANSGFKMSKPAFVYLLRYSSTDQMFGTKFKIGILNKKFGITIISDMPRNKDVKFRIKKLKSAVNNCYVRTEVETVDWVFFDLGSDAKAEENWFMALENFRWLPEHKFEGFTEMYTEGVVEIWEQWKTKFVNSNENI